MLIAVVAILAGVVVGPFVYINFIKEEAPEELSFDDLSPGTTAAEDPDASSPDGSDVELAGTWTVAEGSQAGYRAKEVLFGQDAEAAGRTTDVTGELVIDGTSVTSVEVVVDMTTIASDSDRRDGQFHGRIMSTGEFPEATFSLRETIELGELPAPGTEVTVDATGDFTIRGVTKSLTFSLTARQSGANIQVTAQVPVKWSDFQIPDPSNAAAAVADNGEMEFALNFAKA
jgi:polyisoprenoid-binding protein YceI